MCVVWTWSGILLYRAYGPALVDALRRRRLLAADADLDATEADEEVARRLLVSADPRAARLGLDLLARMASPRMAGELASLVEDARPEVRLAALTALAASGDVASRRRLADEVRSHAGVDGRRHPEAGRGRHSDRWTRATGPLPPALLVDEDVTVRNAALDAVQPGDAFAIAAVLAGLDDVRSLEPAAGAVTRLGDAVLPSMAELLDVDASPASPRARRLVRAAADMTPARDALLRRHVGHRDRELGLLVMERLGAPGPAADATARVLDDGWPTTNATPAGSSPPSSRCERRATTDATATGRSVGRWTTSSTSSASG